MNRETALETLKELSREKGYAICIFGGFGIYFYDGENTFVRDVDDAFLYSLDEMNRKRAVLAGKTGLPLSIFHTIKLKK